MRSDEILIRALTATDLPALATFRCSSGEPFEDIVEQRIRDSRSLALCDRVGLSEELPDQHPGLVQRWGELPRLR